MAAGKNPGAGAALASYHIAMVDIVYELNFGTPLMLGGGTFGTVYAATYAGERAAVKILKLEGGKLTLEQLQVFWREVEMQYALRHDNFVAVHGAVVEENARSRIYAVVTQRMKCSLHDVLHGDEKVDLPLHRRVKVLEQVRGIKPAARRQLLPDAESFAHACPVARRSPVHCATCTRKTSSTRT